MTTHINVTQGPNENGANLIRRFTKLVRNSGIIMTVKGRRYYARENSDYKAKLSALRRIEGAKEYEKQLKLGKIVERTYGTKGTDQRKTS